MAEEHGFSGFNFSNELRAHGVQRAGLRGDDVTRLAQPSKAEGPDAQRIAHADQAVPGQQQQAIGPLQARQRAAHHRKDVETAGMRQQLGNHFGIARGFESDALLLEVAPERLGVREVAVVGDGDRTKLRVLDDHRLGIFHPV